MAILAYDSEHQRVLHIPINQIRSNPYQPRKAFDKAALEELACSIREYGVIQPISVRKYGDRYELVAGERRLRASKIAGMETIPAIIVEISERDSAFLALMENLQRENLNYFEEAEGYANLMQDYGLTQEEVAQKLGKSQSNIANKVRLLKLSEEVKRLLNDYGLTERHARALLKIQDETLRLKVLHEIIAAELNVKKTDEYVNSLMKKTAVTRTKTRKESKNNQKFYIKDVRIYINTIKKAVELITQSGGEANYTIDDNGDSVLVSVVIRRPLIKA